MNKKSLIALSLVVMMALGVACTNNGDGDVDPGNDTDAPIESPAN
jgi:hypothetical protein